MCPQQTWFATFQVSTLPSSSFSVQVKKKMLWKTCRNWIHIFQENYWFLYFLFTKKSFSWLWNEIEVKNRSVFVEFLNYCIGNKKCDWRTNSIAITSINEVWKAYPICRNWDVLLPKKTYSSGNPWALAHSLTLKVRWSEGWITQHLQFQKEELATYQ